ncbi:MAG: pyrroloquinoline quinone biosynthesis protein PqqB [Pseudomonadota bacterium]
MQVRILGSAAGGGFPQWNCNCTNCYGIRNGHVKAIPRTQSSIAISVDGERWILVNASPDIRAQLEAFPAIHPRGLRGTGIHAVILVDSQIDHSTGLLMLREGCPLSVYTTDMVEQDLRTGFPIFELLKSWDGGIDHHLVKIDGSSFRIPGIERLDITAIPLSGKAPPYSPHRHDPHPGDNIGLFVRDRVDGSTLFYAPGLGDVDDELLDVMRRAECVLVDGTFWQEDEMIVAGVGSKLASEMGHLPQSGRGGMIERLRGLKQQRKVLIHINNTNPILIEDSPERGVLDSEGIEVAFDGMQLDLGEHATRQRDAKSDRQPTREVAAHV